MPFKQVNKFISAPKETDWPTLLPFETKTDIVAEFVKATSKAKLETIECSFCGHAEFTENAFKFSDLNVEVLERAVARLRTECQQTAITAIGRRDADGTYVACVSCKTCISTRHKKVKSVPPYSYANGCWIGDLPDELKGLTTLEEMAIARARATKTFVKIVPGPVGQRASKGNVCVLSQEPKELATLVLPPKLSVFGDEIVVVLVKSDQTTITDDVLNMSPLLVRRDRIRKALIWLQSHNSHYSDVTIDHETLNSYPENAAIPLPVHSQLKTLSEENQFGTYVGQSGLYFSFYSFFFSIISNSSFL